MNVERSVRDVAEALRRSLLENERLRRQNERLAGAAGEPIAIVAMSCRYPGGIETPDGLWDLVARGADAIGGFPTDRGWDLARLFDADPEARGHSYSTEGGFLTDPGAFDARLFGISPREALAMDPQQRLLLQAAWESFERAGIPPLSTAGSNVGVYVGGGSGDHPSVLAAAGSALEGEVLTSSASSVLSGRVSYTFGLSGPAITVDTACSSSLVALHLAARALRGGDCDLALAGGVAVMHTPAAFIEVSRQRGLAADGRCKAFAAAADGTGFAEGVGLVLLERLSDARRNGRRVLAVVRGSAVNQDGASNGLSAPNGAAQRRVVRQALADAGLEPGEVDAVEAHGTGTVLGDPIEAQALLATYGRDRRAPEPLWLGSIKSNIGHTQAAAGVAGVIKMVQALRHGVLPATLHVDEPTPHVDWAAGRVRLLTGARDWPAAERPRRAGVSSFGVSGTNAHLILEQAPDPEPAVAAAGTAGVLPYLVTGKDREALLAAAAHLGDLLAADPALSPADLAFALATTRSPLDERAVVLAAGRAELADGLAALAADRISAAVVRDRVRAKGSGILFVFPGHGWQWAGMATELLRAEPVFAAKLAECAAELDPLTGWSLADVLAADELPDDRTDVMQPVLFAVMVALAALWRSRGVEPGAVAGHSQGEIAAACVAGVLSLPDAARIVVRRSRLFADELAGRGTLALIGAPVAAVRELLATRPELAVAAVNNPTATVVAGDEEPLRELVASCVAAGTRARMLPGTVASHCDRVEPLRERLLAAVAGIQPMTSAIPFYSAVTGAILAPTELGPEYWYRNAREPVEFERTVLAALSDGFHTVVEPSAHPWLTAGIEQTAEAAGAEVVVTGTLRRDDGGGGRFTAALAVLHAAGVPVDWRPVFAESGATPIELPTYPFDRTRYWMEPAAHAGDLGAVGLTAVDHPLLAAAVSVASSGAGVITGVLTPRAQPWLADHAIGDTVLLPGAAFAELALRAGAPDGFDRLEELTLEAPLVLPADGAAQLQVEFAAAGADGRMAVLIHSRPAAPGAEGWQRHAAAVLVRADGPEPGEDAEWPPAGAEPVGDAELDGLYDTMAALGMVYGPAFQGLAAAWRTGTTVCAEVRAPAGLGDAERYGIHPALLDAGLHALAFAPAGAAQGRPLLPFAWRGVTLHRTGATALRVRLSRQESGAVAVRVTDDSGRPVLTADAVTLRELPARTADDLLTVGWDAAELDGERSDPELLPGAAPEPLRGVTGAAAPVYVEFRQDAADAAAAQLAVRRALALVQSWLGTAEFDSSTLVVVTRGAVGAEQAGSAIDLAGAAVWGLLRSVQAEHPGRFVLADLDDDPRSRQLLAAAVRTGEPQLALRAGAAFVPRLRRLGAAGGAAAVPWRRGGAVLIVGGTGTIGAELARHLVTEHGVRELVLTSRRGPAAPGAAALREELTAAGAEVTVAACDAADREALRALLATLPELDAIVHAAVVLDDGVVTAQTGERVAAVLRAKVDAAWNLHELTRGPRPPALVLFSSAAGLLGTPGQSGYAAANTYLDALAGLRRAEGLPGFALAWGRWARADGLTAELGADDVARLSRAGIAGMTAAEGLALLDAAAGTGLAAVVPLRVDPVALRTAVAADAAPLLLHGLVRTVRRARSGDRSLTRRLAGLPEPDQRKLLLDTVVTEAGAVLGYADTGRIGPDAAFAELGFTSLTAIEFRNRLAASTGLRLPATVVFDYPTPAELAGFLRETALGAPAAEQAPAAARADTDDPIAIVAMGCRYPGGIESPAALWDFVAAGRDAIAPFPLDRGWRLPAERRTDPARAGGFLDGAADFDPAPFGISPREALAMDPQQRVLLELAWETFERAGIDPMSLRGHRTGVFAGVMYHDYGAQVTEVPEEVAGFLATGVSGSVVSGRISYTFGLEGPAVTVDTACSSSLVALHSALQALRSGECEMALAGGVTVMATPGTFVEFSRQGGLAADGRSKSFAADADGTSISEGAGLLLLERLSDARRNGHPVLALVRGSAVNQDGASNGLTAPNGPAQQRVIRQALRSAGLTAADVDVVEAHGTGTALGDPIEAQAVLATYGLDRPADRPVQLGSLKSNLGHTQAAAGVAGVIKMVEALRHGIVPKTLHITEPSPHVDWAAGAVRLATEAADWPETGRPRRAAVSSFGVSGTNAHVIIEQAPQGAEAAPAPDDARRPLALVLGAATGPAVRAQAAALGELLDGGADPGAAARSLATGRAALEHRAVVLGLDGAELRAGLAAVAAGDAAERVLRGRAGHGRVAFVFPGQGAQWAGMGRELLRDSAVFAEWIDRCAAEMDPRTGWSLHAVLTADGQPPEAVDVVQPASFAVMVALAAVWRAAGVVPDTVVGHSQGEIAAACVAGALSLADAVRVIVVRSRLIAAELSGRGGMASLALPEPRVRALLDRTGTADQLAVAALNGPESTVVSGGADALGLLLAACAEAGVTARRIEVDYASHSAQVDDIAPALAAELAGLAPGPATVPMRSTVTAGYLDGAELTAEYWVRNLREPVLFHPAVTELAATHRFLIEVSPHPVLVPAIQRVIEADEARAVTVGTLRRDDGGLDRLTASFAEAYVAGAPVRWPELLPDGARIALPTYRFQRSRYWLEATPGAAPGTGAAEDAEFWAAVDSADPAAVAAELGIDAATTDLVLPGLVRRRRRWRHRSALGSWHYRVDWQRIEPAGAPEGTWLVVVPAGRGAEPETAAVAGIFAAPVTYELGTAERAPLATELAGFDTVAGVLAVGLAATEALVLIQALGDAGLAAPLWLATRTAVASADPDPGQAQLWGLGVVAGLEHARRWGGLVDLPEHLDEPALARLAAALAGGSGEDQLAIRPSGLLARRIVADVPAGLDAEPGWRTGGTALVTGGTGTLGALIARWAVRNGAERLVLLGRRGPAAPGAAELAAELRELGAVVTVLACDVADRDELAAAVALADSAEHPLRTVVHAAASLELAALASTTAAEFEAMTRAKVRGAEALDELTAGLDLDAFVLFSSVAGVWGSSAHGAYSAANAHLDALARRRRAAGRPALAVAWGVWGTPDMWDENRIVEGLVVGERQTRHGLPPMDPEIAVTALHLALDRDETAVLIGDVKWENFVPLFTMLRPSPLITTVPAAARLLAEPRAAQRTDIAGSALREQLSALSVRDRLLRAVELVRAGVAAVLGHAEPAAVDPDRAFQELGFTSLSAVELRNRLAEVTGLNLPSTMVFDHPTVRELARFLLTEAFGADPAAPEPVPEPLPAEDDPIVIVGMACRYPGGVGSPDELWQLTVDGVDAISGFPTDRGWDLQRLYHPDPEHPGTSYVRHGGFLRDVGDFDAAFFGISPREATAMDPQQRLLLETTWEAFERSGIDPLSLRGSRTGVYVGANPAPQSGGGAGAIDGLAMTGNLSSVLSGRVSYVFGLEGPAVTVDTACSSSLVAMHLAAQALRSGECGLAVASGVMVMLSPAGFIGFSQQRALAPDGRCKAFAAGADGMAFAEGVGVVVLARRSEAERAGHPVLAVLRGSAVNQDGASNGMTAPNGPAQQRVIRAALRRAGLAAAEIDVVEAHGTGTALGDPIEAQALLATYGRDRAPDRPLLLGSIKSNIGHTQAAAGVAGVIKVVQALRHGIVPATLHAGEPTAEVDWSAGTVELVTATTPWPRSDRPRRAAVSSFGISGTNAHVILEQAPARAAEPAPAPARVLPFPVSARSERALRAQAARLLAFLERTPEPSGAELAWSLIDTRAALEHRAVVLAADRAELTAGLAALAAGEPTAAVLDGRARAGGIAFVFPGQGAQRAGMGRELYAAYPAFAAAFDEVCAAADPLLGRPLREVAFDPEQAELLARTEYAQPALFALGLALFRLLESYGVTPDFLIGHSVGELTAACAAGALPVADGARLVVARGTLMQGLPAGGAMVAVQATEAEVAGQLAADLALAAVNGPRSVVLSGAAAAVELAAAHFAELDRKVTRLEVSHAFHSALLDPMLGAFERVCAGMRFAEPRIPVISNRTGEPVTAEQWGAPDYWVRHARETVRFADGIRSLLAREVRGFVELGPDATATASVLGVLEPDERAEVVAVPVARADRDAERTLLAALAALGVAGGDIGWAAWFGGRPPRPVPLPTYAFQHRRFWPEPGVPAAPPVETDAGLWQAIEHGDLAALAAELEVEPGPLGAVLPGLARWRERRAGAAEAERWLYRETWAPVTPTSAVPQGDWLVVVPPGGAPAALTAVLGQTAAVTVLEVGAAETRAGLAARIGALPPQAGVLSLLGTDERPAPGFPVLTAGFTGTALLVQALHDLAAATRVWCVTVDAVTADPADRANGAAQMPVWGLGRVAALEYPERWGGLIDLPADSSAADLAVLPALLAGAGAEDQLAVRDGRAYGRRLTRATVPADGGTPWRPAGTVLVTGGTGALGARVARWAAANGAGHLLLLGRRGPDAPGAAELAAELRGSGAAVTIAACDVADRDAVAALLAALPADQPLTAVVHAAGVPVERMLADTGIDEFAAAMAAKAGGATVLHELTADLGLAAFVLFSSGAAAWGSAANAAYAAGNAFLDGLGRRRRAAGLAATTVAWGNWGGGGMTEGGTAQEALTRRGIRPMAPEPAFALLLRAIAHGETGLTVADIDWKRFAGPFTLARPSALIAAIPEAVPAPADPGGAAGAELGQRLAGLAAADAEAVLTDLVAAEVGAVLGYSGAHLDDLDRPFAELGFDSVTAVELGTRLSRRTGLALPATLVFDHPTAAAVAALLAAELGGAAGAGSVLADLDRLEGRVAAVQDEETRAGLTARLRSLLATLDDAADTGGAGLDTATDDEIFDLIDRDLGVL
ncbi:type I polyketide synthase [Nocardia sp. NPDC057353]|uniref:type I polyketide synthase n=1 Tax=Nocardia sp. NPDC057353 TaxID=3346104 RepID=UPI003641F734